MDWAPSGPGRGEEKVHLGLPGAWAVDSSEPSDHYTTKVGGCPDWPHSLQDSFLRDDLLKCELCGGFLGLVAQVHAPLSLPHGRKLTDRIIYILGCPAPDCGGDPSCWRTIIIQKEHTIVSDVAEAKTRGSNGDSAETIAKRVDSCAVKPSDDWWDEENSWGGESLDGGAGGNLSSEEFLNMDMSDLAASLMEAGRVAAETVHEESRSSLEGNHFSREGRGERVSGTSTGDGPPNPNSQLASPVLPCFYIYFQGEVICHQKASSSKAAFPAEPELKAITVNNPNDESGENGAEAWEGEEYEPDRALHADRTYLKFKRQLDVNPEQCFRYCFGGDVVWALEDGARAAAPGKCGACGGPRVYEMQLMPPLLYFLEQGMKRDSAPPVTYSLDEWDWFTLIVFTCAQSCSQKADDQVTFLGDDNADWTIVEEASILQQEASYKDLSNNRSHISQETQMKDCNAECAQI